LACIQTNNRILLICRTTSNCIPSDQKIKFKCLKADCSVEEQHLTTRF
jgi:hypothetical protein